MKKNKVAIVIPFYRPLNDLEQISLRHLNKYLKRYDKFFVMPKSLQKSFVPNQNYFIMKFPDEYFKSVRKYSELLNTKDFYIKFNEYEYILIYQLDALVFSDKLAEWCSKDYDYIGSPWFNNTLGKLCRKAGTHGNIGNGGLSLRKVEKFLEVLNLAEKKSNLISRNIYLNKLLFFLSVVSGKSHDIWLKTLPKYYPFNEDGFWSLEANKYLPSFKIAPFRDAVKFAFEKEPRKCFKLNNNKLPFGTHAWSRYDPEFWKPYLLSK